MNPSSVTTVQDVTPAMVTPSKTNPRKTFHGLDELAASIKLRGLINPITVRPHPKPPAGVHFELVAGERRWRAAKLARVTTIPVIVRELSDKEVLEIQVIENVQRADVHPMEEAEGFEELIEKHGYDAEQIAAKTGKSKAYVYARLKLCSLADGPRQAFLEDKVSASVALLIARIPDVGLQEEAMKGVLGEADWRAYNDAGVHHERVGPTDEEEDELEDGERGQETKTPLSYRAAVAFLQRKFMLRLELAKFPVADPQLVPTAGACTTCVYRTGNQKELFEDVNSSDVCTKPPCFEAKTRAHFNQVAAAAKEQGVKVLVGEEAEKLFAHHGGIAYNAPVVNPKDKVPWDLLSPGAKPVTWEKLLPKKAELPKVLVQDATGAPLELVDRAAAVRVLREAGKIDKPERPGDKTNDEARKKQAKKERDEKEAKERAFLRLLEKVATVAEAGIAEKKEAAFWRWATAVSLHDGFGAYEEAQEVRARRCIEEDAYIEDLLEKMSGAAARGLLAEVLMCRLASAAYNNYCAKDTEELFAAGCALFSADWKQLLADTKASMKEAAKAEAKLAAKKPAKKGKGK